MGWCSGVRGLLPDLPPEGVFTVEVQTGCLPARDGRRKFLLRPSSSCQLDKGGLTGGWGVWTSTRRRVSLVGAETLGQDLVSGHP